MLLEYRKAFGLALTIGSWASFLAGTSQRLFYSGVGRAVFAAGRRSCACAAVSAALQLSRVFVGCEEC